MDGPETLFAPVLLKRSDYLDMVRSAQRAAQDPEQLSNLLETIRRIEADCEWGPDDDATLKAIQGPLSDSRDVVIVGDESGYYRVIWPHEPVLDDQPRRTLWRSDDNTRRVIVVDQAPITREAVKRLVRFGCLSDGPNMLNLTGISHESQLVTFNLWGLANRSHFWNCNPARAWSSVIPSDRNLEGAWLVSGKGEPVAWAPFPEDARSLANCVNMAMRLESDIAYQGGGLPDLAPRIEQQGILGLVMLLKSSISAMEFGDSEPPKELVAQGIKLVMDFHQYMIDLRKYAPWKRWNCLMFHLDQGIFKSSTQCFRAVNERLEVSAAIRPPGPDEDGARPYIGTLHLCNWESPPWPTMTLSSSAAGRAATTAPSAPVSWGSRSRAWNSIPPSAGPA